MEEETMTESGAGGWAGLRWGSGEAGSDGWMLLVTTGRGQEHDAGSMVDVWGTDPYMGCVSLLRATKPANMNSAATQLYSGFIFFSGEFVVWCFFFSFLFFFLFSHLAGPGVLWGQIKEVVRDTSSEVVLWLIVKTKPSLALVSHWRECFFFGKTLSDSLFHCQLEFP